MHEQYSAVYAWLTYIATARIMRWQLGSSRSDLWTPDFPRKSVIV